jgi:hypothetical protein
MGYICLRTCIAASVFDGLSGARKTIATFASQKHACDQRAARR